MQHRASPKGSTKEGCQYLLNACRGLEDVVLGAVAPVDHAPHLGVHAVPLEGVHALHPHVLVHGRVQHGAVRNVRLPRQILERPSLVGKKKRHGRL